ncbi:MAG TPA: WecB/TagA/CpsF family glycosyltransferase [Lapillicoccus sp.]|nr:WecB/TagA/CpsF family glycosyltransferase [Lapillicoccus sp.]
MTVNDVTAGTVTTTNTWLVTPAVTAPPPAVPSPPVPTWAPGTVKRVSLAGCAVDLCDEPTVAAIVAATLREPTRPVLAVASANLDHVHHFGLDGQDRWRLPRDRESLHWLTLLDGAPLVSRVRRWSGEPYPRLAGADLLGPLLAEVAEAGSVVGFFGGQQEMHDVLRERLAADYPTLRVGGYWSPTRAELGDSDANATLIEQVRAARVDVLVVGLGKPRQELWIDAYAELTGARVLLAFGASADFLAGQVTRAPEWLRDHGLEWCYRLAHEPRRLGRRYLVQGPRAMSRLVFEPVHTLTPPSWL